MSPRWPVAHDSNGEPGRAWRGRPFDPNDTWLRGSVRAVAEGRAVLFAPGRALTDERGFDALASLGRGKSRLLRGRLCGPWIGRVSVELDEARLLAFTTLSAVATIAAFLEARSLPEVPRCWIDGHHEDASER